LKVDANIELPLETSTVLSNIDDTPQHSLSRAVIIVSQSPEPWSAGEFRAIQIVPLAGAIARSIHAI
jgi:hypothetical protein